MKLLPKEIALKNGAPIKLRFAEPSDAQSMLDHLFKTHTESYRNMNQTANAWKLISIEKETEILSDFRSSDSKFMIVALDNSNIIGGLGVVGSLSHFHCKNATLGMSIQKKYSNLGLGTQMMKLAIDTARKVGFHRLELKVRTFNEAGIALYEKCGFEKIGTLKEAALIDGIYFDEYSYQMLL